MSSIQRTSTETHSQDGQRTPPESIRPIDTRCASAVQRKSEPRRRRRHARPGSSRSQQQQHKSRELAAGGASSSSDVASSLRSRPLSARSSSFSPADSPPDHPQHLPPHSPIPPKRASVIGLLPGDVTRAAPPSAPPSVFHGVGERGAEIPLGGREREATLGRSLFPRFCAL